MEQDLALFVVDHASKLSADKVDVKLGENYNKLITVANGKVQRRVISRKRGIGITTLFDGALGILVNNKFDKKYMTQAAGIAFKVAKTSTVRASLSCTH